VSESKHSPEPWAIIRGHETGRPMGLVAGEEHVVCWGGISRSASEVGDANARRIVAAVNACAGIPTEALEAGALGKALDLLKFGSIDESDPCQGDEPGCPECEAVNVLRALGRLP
jgi:hypothetical protein